MYFNLWFLNMARKIKILNQTNPYVHIIAATNKTEIKNNKVPSTQVKQIALKLLLCLYNRKISCMAVHTYELRHVPVRELKHLTNDLPKPASQISSPLVHNLVLAAEGEG
jgi:hypothetical protein